MLFSSFEFPVFFALVYLLYIVLTHRYQNILLLVASYFFYGCWSEKFLTLIFLSTVIDFFTGHEIYKSKEKTRKKLFLMISVFSNLGMLAFFKYFNFFAENLHFLLESVGLSANITTLNIILPVGISFYTFQTMSYTIDIYRGTLKPTEKFLDFAVFVAFFPQLVAGPIERASHLLPQIEKIRKIRLSDIERGLWLIARGYIKKVVLADNLAPYAMELFSQPEGKYGFEVMLGIYAFAFQIYGDFSGYTDIARGISRLMGFDLMENFKRPYFAVSPSDFWRRWHISLSTWLRDYLYIPLGGNKLGKLNTYRNLMITMVLGGVWHGAAWNFVLWGIYHGGLLAIHRMISPYLERLQKALRLSNKAWHFISMIIFFQLTCIGWMLFAAQSIPDILTISQNLFNFTSGSNIPLVALATILTFALPILYMEIYEERHHDEYFMVNFSYKRKVAIYALFSVCITFLGVIRPYVFIYFQF
ncbi:MAG: membrane-bound O-acyltransferase family protein [Bacteriovorax sp. MedPE-SWde]|nr:MAG: membrane-bound O-acyltransferase family protein [Bacteriovorax sp. MedPE-SWde]